MLFLFYPSRILVFATTLLSLNGCAGHCRYTKGLQEGEDSRYLQAISTLKHWDAYSLEDSDGYTRHNFNAIISNYTLADSYFPAFKVACSESLNAAHHLVYFVSRALKFTADAVFF